jgi:hypothetical protein
MTIGARTSDRCQGHLTTRTGAVHHNDSPADAFFERRRITPRVKVRCPTSGEANNDFNRPIRPTRLRQGRRGQKGAG